MNVLKRLSVVLSGVALCWFAQANVAQAQQAKTINILVGFPPGGSTDMVARVLADKLRVELNEPVVVENKPGAGGRVASLALKNSAPDGHTYLIMPNASAILNHLLYPTDVLGYDLLRDMTPVAMLVSGPIGLAINTKVTGVDTAKGYIEWVRKSGQAGLYGTAGQGGQTHFTGLALGKAANIDMKVVPYRGNAPMLTDLLGGQIPAGVAVVADLLQHTQSGPVKLVGVFGDERSPLAPDVPTFKEQGINLETGDAWTGMWAPAQTPPAEIERMQTALKKVLAQPDTQSLLRGANLLTDYRPGSEVAKLIDKELAYWRPIIDESGFTPEK